MVSDKNSLLKDLFKFKFYKRSRYIKPQKLDNKLNLKYKHKNNRKTNFFNRRLKNKVFSYIRNKRRKSFIFNLRGYRIHLGLGKGSFYKRRFYYNLINKYIVYFYPNITTGRNMYKFFKKKFRNREFIFITKLYNYIFSYFEVTKKLRTIFNRISKLIKYKANKKQKKRKKRKLLKRYYLLKYLQRKFANKLKKHVIKSENKLIFSIKNFFRYYILILFSNYNFKFFFFKILTNINLIENERHKNLFIKYEFFGHSYFKRKLFFLFKFKMLNYFLKKLNIEKITKKYNFNIKIKTLRCLRYNILYIKYWVLYFFLNKYNNLQQQNNQILKKYIVDLNKVFFLYFTIFDRNFKSFIIYNKKFISWLYYNNNRKKNKMNCLILQKAINFKRYVPLVVDFRDKNQIKSFYKSLIFLQITIKLNNVFTTVSNIKGQVLFKYSTGFYGVRGRKKRDLLTLSNIINNISKKLKKFKKLTLIIKIKRRFRNKYLRKVIKTLKKNQINPLYYFFLVNREISKKKLKKIRRL